MRQQWVPFIFVSLFQFAQCFLSTPGRSFPPTSSFANGIIVVRLSTRPYNIKSSTQAHTDLATGVDGPVQEGQNRDTVVGRLCKKYHQLCELRPFPTKSITAGIVAGLGAILCQWIPALSLASPTTHSLAVDWHKVRSFALTGLVFEGPYMHLWFEQLFWLGRYLESKHGVSSRISTGFQIAVDQTIGVAFFFPAYFFVYECCQSLILLRGESVSSLVLRTFRCMMILVSHNS